MRHCSWAAALATWFAAVCIAISMISVATGYSGHLPSTNTHITYTRKWQEEAGRRLCAASWLPPSLPSHYHTDQKARDPLDPLPYGSYALIPSPCREPGRLSAWRARYTADFNCPRTLLPSSASACRTLQFYPALTLLPAALCAACRLPLPSTLWRLQASTRSPTFCLLLLLCSHCLSYLPSPTMPCLPPPATFPPPRPPAAGQAWHFAAWSSCCHSTSTSPPSCPPPTPWLLQCCKHGRHALWMAHFLYHFSYLCNHAAHLLTFLLSASLHLHPILPPWDMGRLDTLQGINCFSLCHLLSHQSIRLTRMQHKLGKTNIRRDEEPTTHYTHLAHMYLLLPPATLHMLHVPPPHYPCPTLPPAPPSPHYLLLTPLTPACHIPSHAHCTLLPHLHACLHTNLSSPLSFSPLWRRRRLRQQAALCCVGHAESRQAFGSRQQAGISAH